MRIKTRARSRRETICFWVIASKTRAHTWRDYSLRAIRPAGFERMYNAEQNAVTLTLEKTRY